MPHRGVQRRADRQRRRSGGDAPAPRRAAFCFRPDELPDHTLHANGERINSMKEGHSRWIAKWNPEDVAFWNTQGKTIARRNLIWSIVAEHLGFSIWLIWSIVATKLP